MEQLQAAVASRITDQRMSLADMKAALTQRIAELERLEKQLSLERIRQAQLHLQNEEGRARQGVWPVPQEVRLAGPNGHQPHQDFTTDGQDYTGLDVEGR